MTQIADTELRQHIDDATHLMFRSYGLFREFGCPQDRIEAVEMLHTQQEALRARTPSMLEEDRQELEERWNFFGSDAAVGMARRQNQMEQSGL